MAEGPPGDRDAVKSLCCQPGCRIMGCVCLPTQPSLCAIGLCVSFPIFYLRSATPVTHLQILPSSCSSPWHKQSVSPHTSLHPGQGPVVTQNTRKPTTSISSSLSWPHFLFLLNGILSSFPYSLWAKLGLPHVSLFLYDPSPLGRQLGEMGS